MQWWSCAPEKDKQKRSCVASSEVRLLPPLLHRARASPPPSNDHTTRTHDRSTAASPRELTTPPIVDRPPHRRLAPARPPGRAFPRPPRGLRALRRRARDRRGAARHAAQRRGAAGCALREGTAVRSSCLTRRRGSSRAAAVLRAPPWRFARRRCASRAAAVLRARARLFLLLLLLLLLLSLAGRCLLPAECVNVTPAAEQPVKI